MPILGREEALDAAPAAVLRVVGRFGDEFMVVGFRRVLVARAGDGMEMTSLEDGREGFLYCCYCCYTPRLYYANRMKGLDVVQGSVFDRMEMGG